MLREEAIRSKQTYFFTEITWILRNLKSSSLVISREVRSARKRREKCGKTMVCA